MADQESRKPPAVLVYEDTGAMAPIVYFDIVSATNPPAMAALMKLTTAAQLLFGTDIPYMKAESSVSGLASLGLSAAEIRAIECDNALRIMPSLKRGQF